MAQSRNAKVDIVVKGTSYVGLNSYGKIMVGDKAFEFYNERNPEDNIQIPWEEVNYVIGSVWFKKYIVRYAIETKNNGTYSFSSKQSKDVLRAVRKYVPSEKMVQSLGFFDVLIRNIKSIFHKS